MRALTAASSATLTLTVVSHEDTEAPKSFSRREGGTVVIGRSSRSGGETPSSDNALFRNQVLSRSHATLAWQQDGSIFITDDKSTHGTVVQRSPRQIVVGPLPTRLLHGDQLILGKTVTRANENKTSVNYEPLILKVSIVPDRKVNPKVALPAAPRRYALQTQEQLFTDEEDEQVDNQGDESDVMALDSDSVLSSQKRLTYRRQSPSSRLNERVDQFMKDRKRNSQSPEQQYKEHSKEDSSKADKRPTPILISGSDSGSEAVQSPPPLPSSPESVVAEQTRVISHVRRMPSQLRDSNEYKVEKGDIPSIVYGEETTSAPTNQAVKVPGSDSEDKTSKQDNNDNADIEESVIESSPPPPSSPAMESEAVPRYERPLVMSEEESEEEDVEVEEDQDEFMYGEEIDEDDEDNEEHDENEEDEEDEIDEVVPRRKMIVESDDEEDSYESQDESDEEDDIKKENGMDEDSEDDEVSEDSSQIFDLEPTPSPPVNYKSVKQRENAVSCSDTSDEEHMPKKVRLVESEQSDLSQPSNDASDTEHLVDLPTIKVQPGFARASDLLVKDTCLGTPVNVLQAKRFKKPMRDAGIQAEAPPQVSMAVQTVIEHKDVEVQAEHQGTQEPEIVSSVKKRTHDVMLVTDDIKAVEGIEESSVIAPLDDPDVRPKKGLPWRAAARYTSVFALGAFAAVVGLATIPELD